MKRKQALIRLEKAIIRESRYIEFHSLAVPVSDWDKQRRENLRQQLETRRQLLNEMFLCTEEEVADFRKINDRLFELTQKMHEKALNLYRDILRSGFDPDFDDDIMVEGRLRFVFCNEWNSVPDLLRMNDFWCEVKVTHQLLSDRDGKRVSYIINEEN